MREYMDICFYPSICNVHDAAICTRLVNWALSPLSPRARIIIPTQIDLRSEDWPDYCEVINGRKLSQAAAKAETIIFWRGESFWAAPAKLRRKGLICDPYTSIAATDTLNAWVNDNCKPLHDGSNIPNVFKDISKSSWAAKRDVLIIGSSPSLSELMMSNKLELGNPLCLYMGGTIYNEELISRFPPDIIVAADGTSQFSGLKPALMFKEQVVALMKRTGVILMAPDVVSGFIEAHWPESVRPYILTLPYLDAEKTVDTRDMSLHENWAIRPPLKCKRFIGSK